MDPAELDPTVLALSNVVHVRLPIQAAHASLRALLSGQSTTGYGRSGIDAARSLIVNSAPVVGGVVKAQPRAMEGYAVANVDCRESGVADGGEATKDMEDKDCTAQRVNGAHGEDPVPSPGERRERRSGLMAEVMGDALRAPHADSPSNTDSAIPSSIGASSSARRMADRCAPLDPEVNSPSASGTWSEIETGSLDTTCTADVLVSDMNAEPRVVATVLLSALQAGLVKPGGVIVATFKDFCGRERYMREEVEKALARLEAGDSDAGTGSRESTGVAPGGVCDESGGDGCTAVTARVISVNEEFSTNKTLGVTEAGDRSSVDENYELCADAKDTNSDSITEVSGAASAAADSNLGRWRLEAIETFHLLSGGRTEVTLVGRVAGGGGHYCQDR